MTSTTQSLPLRQVLVQRWPMAITACRSSACGVGCCAAGAALTQSFWRFRQGFLLLPGERGPQALCLSTAGPVQTQGGTGKGREQGKVVRPEA